MKRLHILLRLFVLAAMTLSIAETVWASACASMATMAVSRAAATASDAMPDMPGMPADDEQHDGNQDPWCPLGPAAAAQGCLTAASLPAISYEPFTITGEREAHVTSVETANELIYGATLFHPPRA